jgi:hypothetical protein
MDVALDIALATDLEFPLHTIPWEAWVTRKVRMLALLVLARLCSRIERRNVRDHRGNPGLEGEL